MEKKYIKPEVEVVDLTNQLLAGSTISTSESQAEVTDGNVTMQSKQGGWGWSDED